MQTCIIVLNWNAWPDTVNCLESLFFLKQQAAILVCDNASDDESVSRLRQWAEQRRLENVFFDLGETAQPPFQAVTFTLLRTTANRGFAAGHNAALRYAMQNPGFEFFWLLNNDLKVQHDALDNLLRCARLSPQSALFGSTVLDYTPPHKVQCAGGCVYNPWLTVFRNVMQGSDLHQAIDNPQEPHLDYIYGAAMFLRAGALRQTGLLNEDYFLFYEELDLSRRLRRATYQIRWCRHSVVYHKGGTSTGSATGSAKHKRILANYHENLSTLKYTARFHPRLLWIAACTRLFGKIAALTLRREFYLFSPLWRAYRDFWRFFTSKKEKP